MDNIVGLLFLVPCLKERLVSICGRLVLCNPILNVSALILLILVVPTALFGQGQNYAWNRKPSTVSALGAVLAGAQTNTFSDSPLHRPARPRSFTLTQFGDLRFPSAVDVPPRASNLAFDALEGSSHFNGHSKIGRLIGRSDGPHSNSSRISRIRRLNAPSAGVQSPRLI